MKDKRILFVTTSHDKMGDTQGSTGVWLEELAAPYYVFKDAGAEITIASPKGGAVPIDPKSRGIIIVTRSGKRFLSDPDAMGMLSNSTAIAEIDAANFDVVFLPGGHGCMWDLTDNNMLKTLLENFHNTNKPIGAVSQGVVGLMSLQKEDGELLIKGRQLTSFSNSEEKSKGLINVVPFLLEEQLLLLGAHYSSGADYISYIVVDENIITGQNAASSEAVARKIVALVRGQKYDVPVTDLLSIDGVNMN